MGDLPHPDSEAIGRLIDQYLGHRRRSGWNSRQVQREAEHLGDAAANQWSPKRGASQRALERFVAWRDTVRDSR